MRVQVRVGLEQGKRAKKDGERTTRSCRRFAVVSLSSAYRQKVPAKTAAQGRTSQTQTLPSPKDSNIGGIADQATRNLYKLTRHKIP